MAEPKNRKEAFSRVVIDDQLRDAGWNLTDGTSVRYEYRLPDGPYADFAPLYMLFLFQSAAIRQAMGKLATGTSDSMRNISQGKLKCLPVPVPPLEIQEVFSSRAVDIGSLITQQERSLAQAEALMHSLMARYFGEAGTGKAGGSKAPSPLTLSRRERGVKTTPLSEH